MNLESKSGEFLLDTWHNKLGNIRDFKNRQTADGYNFRDAMNNLQNRKSGNLCFISQTTGKKLYMHYEPTKINDWNVMVTIDEATAFSKMQSISGYLYGMAAVCGATLLIYMGCVVFTLLKVHRRIHELDTVDQITKLKNRNAFDTFIQIVESKMFQSLTCAYVDVNGLHEVNNNEGHAAGDQMLQLVADVLKESFSYKDLYRIGGDEYVVISEDLSQEDCNKKMKQAIKKVEKEGYSISVGITSKENIVGIEEIIKEADEKMLEDKREYYKKHDRRKR